LATKGQKQEEIMKRYIGVILILTALLTFACTLVSNTVEQNIAEQDIVEQDVAEQTAPAATAVTQTDDPAQPASPPLAGDQVGLTSYRSRTVVTDLETGERQETTAEAIIDPFALRMDLETGEMILTEAGVWMSLPGIGWYQMDFTAEELAMSREQLMALEWGDMDELPDIPPWPADIIYMPDQASLSLVEGGLTPVGRETINGIACRQYSVITDYSYEFPETDFSRAGQERMQATGSVWVADQADLPALVIRADIEQTATRLIGGQEVVWQHRIEYEITAVNIPLAIEPPADAMTLTEMYEDWDDDFDDTAVAPATLSELDSYRLVITIRVTLEDIETTRTTTFEWVRDPRAYRYVEEMEDFSMAWLGVGDDNWMRVTGSDWMEIAGEEPDFPLGAAEWVYDDEMELVGTAVVNGINCQHYRFEMTFSNITSQTEVWVADQPDLPTVVIRSLTQTEQPGQTTITDVNLYDINQPLAIDPPG